jgi:hypothetical protein
MSQTVFEVTNYSIRIGRDMAGASVPNMDAWIWLVGVAAGTVYDVFLEFQNEEEIPKDNVWFPANRFGRIYMRRYQLPVIIDILRNEKPVYCVMNDVFPQSCYVGTGWEPVGEEERSPPDRGLFPSIGLRS